MGTLLNSAFAFCVGWLNGDVLLLSSVLAGCLLFFMLLFFAVVLLLSSVLVTLQNVVEFST